MNRTTSLSSADSAAVTHAELQRRVRELETRLQAAEQRLALEERQRQVRESDERLRATFEHAPVGISETSLDGTLLRVNDGFCRIVGYSREALQGGLFQSITHPDDLPANLEHYRRLQAGEVPYYEMEKRYIRPDGSIVWVHLFGSVVRGEDGKAAYGVAVIQDITERKRAQEALRAHQTEREALLRREQRARLEAEDASRLKDEFLATVSHELRTPLNAITGWTAVARMQGSDPAAVQRALEIIERNARAQKQLIEDLLDVSRIITGKLKLELGPVDVRRVAEAALDTAQAAAAAKNIALLLRCDTDLPVIAADFTRLQQVVWNLLANAVKFTPEGGSVSVAVTRDRHEVEIAVHDTGEGIAPEFLPFVFDRFRQADGSITRRHGGLGLGLAIVRHIVELHGGRVRVESQAVGHGSTFIVRLPAPENVVQGLRSAASGLLDSAILAGLRLLVVEDDRDTLRMLEELLQGYGARVRAVSSAAEALAALEGEVFDLLVADVAMPDMDGYTLIHAIRERGGELARLPAVALTAYGRLADRLRALSAGFQNHVAKPADPEELALVIARTAQREGS
jgi:PAS domain S-box-containing protein